MAILTSFIALFITPWPVTTRARSANPEPAVIETIAGEGCLILDDASISQRAEAVEDYSVILWPHDRS